MFSRGSISILVALATAGGVALADPMPTNAEINQAESGNPASVDYPNRPVSTAGDVNAGINQAESWNPDSPDYRNRVISGTGNPNAAWEESEAGHPDSAQPGKRERRIQPDSLDAARCSTQAQCKEQRTK